MRRYPFFGFTFAYLFWLCVIWACIKYTRLFLTWTAVLFSIILFADTIDRGRIPFLGWDLPELAVLWHYAPEIIVGLAVLVSLVFLLIVKWNDFKETVVEVYESYTDSWRSIWDKTTPLKFQIEQNGKTEGPFTLAELKSMNLPPNTPCAGEKEKQWYTLGDVLKQPLAYEHTTSAGEKIEVDSALNSRFADKKEAIAAANPPVHPQSVNVLGHGASYILVHIALADKDDLTNIEHEKIKEALTKIFWRHERIFLHVEQTESMIVIALHTHRQR